MKIAMRRKAVLVLTLCFLCVLLTGCGAYKLSDFGNVTITKFCEELNSNLASLSKDTTAPEFVETVKTIDAGEVTTYVSAVSANLSVTVLARDNTQTIYLYQSKAKDAADADITAGNTAFATVTFALIKTIDPNADMAVLLPQLETDTLWDTSAKTDYNGYHYYYNNRSDANILVITKLTDETTAADNSDTDAAVE